MSDPASSVIWDYPYPVVPYFTPGALASPSLLSHPEMFLSARVAWGCSKEAHAALFSSLCYVSAMLQW